ncbi:hypothetical protein EW145_g3674 [Phellinidium pouzarii]|uniref:Non-structural maintenance of chromosomes element 4 n=1 Tax=Phellinidium pouzarii TaxID=167371 RepID=A0A4S4L6Q9_9AGAM|nr:hypothetical protein EW145_g3674 [Phellinidium pouzarii]
MASNEAQKQSQQQQQPQKTQQPAASAASPSPATAQNTTTPANIIAALSSAFKTSTGESLQNDKIASLLLANMEQITELAKQGRLSQTQITQLRQFAINNNKDVSATAQSTQQASAQPTASSSKSLQSTSTAPLLSNALASTSSAFKSSSPAPNGGATLSSITGNGYPISQTLNVTNPGPQSFPSAVGRPTLSGGFAGGRISGKNTPGTPAQIARTDDPSVLGFNDMSNRRKNAPNDQSMRRSIQDLVYSIDPNVKIEPEVEDLLLDIADEFIDSVTNFGCRLAKHRGGDSLEVRDLQLHLERNHNIRIPGFASDETRISISQSSIAPAAGPGGASGKKSAQNANVTHRSQRLAQVAQAKKEAKRTHYDEEDEGAESVPGSPDSDLVYDPDQDREEKRAIRKNYRSLQEDETLMSANAIGIDSLTKKIRAADKLFQKVKGPQEATLDSAFLVTASNLGAVKARQMRADVGGFDVDDFVAKLVTFMGGHWRNDEEDGDIDDEHPLNWDSVGRRALAKSRRIPAMDFMLGPLSVEPKKRNFAKRNRLEKSNEVEKRPQELGEEDIEKSENETTKNVLALEKFLAKQDGPTNLFRIIINPTSFGQSVENLFYLSFLIRDGKVTLEITEDNEEPVIWLCEAPTDNDYSEGVRKKQMVMELDMETWKKAIEVFDIKESAIPTRKAAKTRLGNKWYG